MPVNDSAGDVIDKSNADYQLLVKTIAEEDPILFAGAGCSVNLGYPLWGDLLARLEERARASPDADLDLFDRYANENPLRRAEHFRDAIGEDYFDILANTYGVRDPQFDALNTSLLRLPFRHVITTNYDPVLPGAHYAIYGTDAAIVSHPSTTTLFDFLEHRDDSNYGRRYVHLHGRAEDARNILLCESDYQAAYAHSTVLDTLLRNLLTCKHFVFVGFHLKDPWFERRLQLVTEPVALSQPRHFILLDDSTANRERETTLRDSYHTIPLYYTKRDEKHSGLLELIQALEEDVATVRSAIEQQTLNALLKRYPASQHSSSSSTHAIRTSEVSPISAAAVSKPEPLDDIIASVFPLVLAGKPDEAISKYKALEQVHEGRLTPKQRYLIRANIGNAHYSKADSDEAASAYLQAVAYFADSRDAKAIQALAYHLKGDTERARSLAQALCEVEPDFARAHALLVRSQSLGLPFERVESLVPPELRDTGEVAMALSEYAELAEDFDNWERYGRAAVTAEPTWSDALSQLAASLLRREQSLADITGEGGLICANPARVAEAISILTKAISHLPPGDPAGRLGGLHFMRAMANRLLGEEQQAKLDIRKAFQLRSDDPSIIHAFALEAESTRDITEALDSIGSLGAEMFADEGTIRFAEMVLLQRRADDGDMARAYQIGCDLCSRLDEMRPISWRGEIVRLTLQIGNDISRAGETAERLASIPDSALEAYDFALIRGRAAAVAGDEATADAEAQLAIALLGPSVDKIGKRRVAMFAMEAGLFKEALPIWEEIADTKNADSDSLKLLYCAFHARKWKRVLEVCEQAKQEGRLKRDHIEFQVNVLVASRDVPKAIEVLRQWVRDNPEDKISWLYLFAMVAQQRGGDIETSRLPAIGEIQSASDAAMLVSVLQAATTPERAVEAAYQLWRRFPDERATLDAFVRAMLTPDGQQPVLAECDLVGPGAAVLITDDSEQARWVYVERGESPSATRSEYAPDHPLSRALEGRMVGDTVEYLHRKYVIRQITSNILRRSHELMQDYGFRVPKDPAVQTFHMGPISDGPEAIEEIKKSDLGLALKEQEERVRYLDNLYSSNRIPISAYARALGRSAFQVVLGFAGAPNRHVAADDGGGARDGVSLALLREKKAILLDQTALASCLLHELLPIIPLLGYELLVPQSARDEIASLAWQAGNPRQPRGYLGMHQGTLIFHQPTSEELAREVEGLESVLKFIEDHCELVGGAESLEVPFDEDMRAQIIEVVGESTFDAIAIASARNAVLWSDDMGLRRLAGMEGIDVQSVWSQEVLQAAAARGATDRTGYIQVLGRMIANGYGFLRLSAKDVVDLYEMDGWSAETRMAVGMRKVLGGQGVLNPHNYVITGTALVYVWQQSTSRDVARDIIAGVLQEIRNPRIRMSMYRALRKLPEPPVYMGRSMRSLKRMVRRWRSRDGEFRPLLRR